jgi:hypothetical protein
MVLIWLMLSVPKWSHLAAATVLSSMTSMFMSLSVPMRQRFQFLNPYIFSFLQQDQLEKSVIHGDLNEQNLLVRPIKGSDKFEIFRFTYINLFIYFGKLTFKWNFKIFLKIPRYFHFFDKLTDIKNWNIEQLYASLHLNN